MSFDKPFLIIGHRGAAGLEPENTLRSFSRAVELGVDAVELDVHWVHEELIVIHDDTLERTTDGSGLLDSISLDELRSKAKKAEHSPADATAFKRYHLNIPQEGVAEPWLDLDIYDKAQPRTPLADLAGMPC